jgi:hypothetical protein
LAGALEEGCSGARFFGKGAGEVADTGEDIELGSGGARFYAEGVGSVVEGADPLSRWDSIKNGDGRVFELGAKAEHGLGGKFADVEAGVKGAHLRPDFVGMGCVSGGTSDDHGVRLFQRMLWSLWGGLRRSKSTIFVEGAKRSRAISTRCSELVKTVVDSGWIWPGWQWRTRPALLLVQACWVSRRTLACVRSAAAR